MRFAVPLAIDAHCFASWRQDDPIAEVRGETMGTTWCVKVAAPAAFDRTALSDAIEARLETILAQMSHWREDSLLSRFNQAKAGEWHMLPREFGLVMNAALQVADRSGGAFDPAIGALVDLWGHGPVAMTTLPTQAAVTQALDVSGFSRLAHDREPARLRQPGRLRLDLSGIAKGFAVDALAELLRARGFHHALVEIGGELIGLGLRPDGNPWWVDLETPANGIAPLRVALHQLAVATSGDYVRGRHTIDPRSGHPVEHAMAVSIIHRSAMMADAWATALSVHQPAAMKALAIREKLSVRALIRADDAIAEWISPALEAMLEPAEDAPTAS